MNKANNPLTDSVERTALRIDIFSDVICPWCFIGKRRLEKALNAWNGRSAYRISWRPFQLNPAMPRAGTDRTAYLDAKFGGSHARQALEARVAAVGRTEGIPFAFDRIQRTPNTFDAHRLIWLSQREGRQDLMVEGFFRSYFIDAEDIGDRRTLVEVAGRAGLDPARTEQFLGGDEGVIAVRDEEEKGRRMGIAGVPHFVVNDTFVISGAQEPQTLVSAFERVIAGTTSRG